MESIVAPYPSGLEAVESLLLLSLSAERLLMGTTLEAYLESFRRRPKRGCGDVVEGEASGIGCTTAAAAAATASSSSSFTTLPLMVEMLLSPFMATSAVAAAGGTPPPPQPLRLPSFLSFFPLYFIY